MWTEEAKPYLCQQPESAKEAQYSPVHASSGARNNQVPRCRYLYLNIKSKDCVSFRSRWAWRRNDGLFPFSPANHVHTKNDNYATTRGSCSPHPLYPGSTRPRTSAGAARCAGNSINAPRKMAMATTTTTMAKSAAPRRAPNLPPGGVWPPQTLGNRPCRGTTRQSISPERCDCVSSIKHDADGGKGHKVDTERDCRVPRYFDRETITVYRSNVWGSFTRCARETDMLQGASSVHPSS